MERTLCIQVLGATGSGKTKLLALITTLLRKEGVLIVGSGSETVCAESVQVKFDVEAHDEMASKELTGYRELVVKYDDESVMTIPLGKKRLLHENGVFAVYDNGLTRSATYEAGVRNVVSVAALD